MSLKSMVSELYGKLANFDLVVDQNIFRQIQLRYLRLNLLPIYPDMNILQYAQHSKKESPEISPRYLDVKFLISSDGPIQRAATKLQSIWLY